MHFAFPAVIIFLIIYGPHLWVHYILIKYHQHRPGIPGTGGELARHLLKQYQLGHVKVEQTDKGKDHYDPTENSVCLSPEVYNGKSLTAVAVAAHEVGHAIQFNRQEPVSFLRKKYLNKAHAIQHYGIYILICAPIIGALLGLPHITIFSVFIGVITLLASVLMYAAILPEEWDASFNKALPILEKGGYVPQEHLPVIRQILKACALTYVAAALADILNLWRWLAIIK